MRKYLPRLWQAGGSLRWFTALAALLAMTLVSSALAAPITVVDDGGADDEPGQKDLSQMTIDYQPNNGFDLTVAWNWDDISVSGNNTGDACSLFDTDGDGNANYSLCVVWGANAVYQNTILYSCGDTRADRCDQPTAILSQDLNADGKLDGNYSSTCSVQQVNNSDPFHLGQPDTVATCNIKLSDFGTQTDPFLVNVCSYPSGEPNSAPSDCVVSPNSGFLTIVKDAGNDTTTDFNFTLSPAANNNLSQFTITGSGSEALIPVDATINYSLAEGALPAGWQLADAECTVGGSSTGTFSGSTISGIDIQVGKETVCTFTNEHIIPTLLVEKTANPSTLPETGDTVTYTYTVTNTSSVPLTISSLSDDKFGTLAGDADCAIGTVLAPGASCLFTYTPTSPLSGNAGTTHTNVFTAVAAAAWGATATDTDDAVVTFTDVAPTLEVTKTANPTSVPETGGSVTFTYTVENTSAEPVTITALSDDKFGVLAGDADCKIGTLLAPGTSCSFTFTPTSPLSGDAGTSHTNIFTATVEDDDGSSVTDTDDAVVTFTDVAPTLEVTKTANPTSVPETGGSVTFTYTVKNTSAENVWITALGDDKFTITGNADCQVGTMLAPGDSCEFTYTTTLAGEPGTPHVNVFSVTVRDNENTTATDTDDATVTFTDIAPVITVDKSANPTSVPETGGSVTFTYTVTNSGTEPVTITSLQDNKFPLVVGDADCQVGTVLPVNGSCTFTYTTTLKGDAGSSHVNELTVEAIDNDGTTATGTDDAIVTFTDVKPSITVDKSADPTSVPETGGSVTFTYVVTNNTAEPATITNLDDTVFGSLAGDADCKLDTVIPGNGSCTFEYTTTISGDYPGQHLNVFTATVKDDEGNTASDDDDAIVAFTDVLPDITVTKTANPSSVPETGANVTFTFTVTNNGLEDASITALSDSVFGTLAGDADCQVGTVLAGGASCSFAITQWIAGDASVSDHTNVFTGTVTDDDGNQDSDDDDETVDITDVLPDISVTKTANPSSVPETGANVTFTFTVTNNGLEDASITALSDSVFGTLAGDADCQIGTVLAGRTSCSFAITKWIAGDAPGIHTNVFTATVTDNEGNQDSDNDDENVGFEDVKPAVSVTKTANPTSLPETGGDVTYTFTVTNDSTEAAIIISLVDSKFGLLAGDDDCKATIVLAAGASCEFTLTRSISGDTGVDHVNVFTATVGDDDNNIASDDDDATVVFTDVLPAVSVTKTANPTSVPETGGSVTYTFVVTNDSDEAGTIAELGDDKFGTLTGDVDCQVGTILQPGASCEFTLTKTISGDYPGSHVNVFTATVSDDDGNSASDDDDATVDFTDVKPAVTVTKTANPTSVPESGANVTYTFVVTNNSTEAAKITELGDDKFGTLTGDADCKLDTVLAAGASCEFTLTKFISGDYPGSHVNVFTATVSDDDGNLASDDDDATVTFTDVLPDVVITKTANPTAVPATGGNVTFTFTVWNKSTEAATLTTLTDTVFGNLDGKGTCDIPVTLAATNGTVGGADTYTCTYTVFIKATAMNSNGMGYVSHYNVATGTVTDDDGNSDTGSDDATVSFTWRGRTPGYWKNHPTEWPTNFTMTNYKGQTVAVTTSTNVRSVFNVPTSSTFSCIKSGDKLMTALSYKGGSTLCGATQILLRAATAGLLNEISFGDAYPAFASPQDLINAVNAAIATGNRQTIINLANQIDYWNNGVH